MKGKSSALLAAMMMMASMTGGNQYAPRRRRDPLEGIDIEKEYGLIQKKKSGLSARMRGMVEYRMAQINQGRLS